MLPHGHEGQGPEHTSARIERFLTLCAENNMQIINCTTPANFFHVLRRQLKRNYRKPLVIFTPKSLLRNPKCRSSLKDFSKGKFYRIFDDFIDPLNVKKLVLCSGKIYYELLEKRKEFKHEDVALVRLEQLYPLPIGELKDIINKYSADKIIWVQEEPENMGAWTYISSCLREYPISLISRKRSAATASGSSKNSAIKQEKIINDVFKY